MINVQLEPGGPITQMDEGLLSCRYGVKDTPVEYTEWIEFYLPDDDSRPVHRSVHVTLKRGLDLNAVQGSIGG